MKLDLFDYYLPEELIAQTPLEQRDTSRLLKLDRQSGEVTHGSFRDIKKYLKKGDCLILNDTRVIPARLYGQREDSGAEIEFLLLKRISTTDWEVIVRPGKKLKEGRRAIFGDGKLKAEILTVLETGNRIVRFEYDGVFENILEELGEMPLPHYITHKLEDKNRYQTVYAKYDGSAAAPTAGLHFTPELMDEIREMGVTIAYVTLHVGLGTFRPVKVENIEEHEMHSEYYIMPEETANIINETKQNGGRVIAVGTTSCRTLESVADENGTVRPCSGSTDIFIYPGYKFKLIDGLITNFHLPKSTLIMLVSTFAGRENTMNAYKEAVDEKYRFFSFGDSMIII
ncbi:MAG: tRNA preQ1(34) S-adenosylmethionine ribosyltransferase-isomerase QueA [Clostridia bacterium]|nr:tRNA preQ1(34) S-adenosylmethionine ribosyltransferase-isomerase QueA [Clostridia bacterium]